MPPITSHFHPSTPRFRRFILSLLSPPPHTPIQRILRPFFRPFLPKKTFIGHDLRGNSYWELHTRHLPTRPRRLVEYAEKQQDIGGYNVEDPAWHQWLRCVREDAPTIRELMGDVARREELKRRVGKIEERERVRREALKQDERVLLGGPEVVKGEKKVEAPEPKVVVEEAVKDEENEVERVKEDPWAKAQREREEGGEEGTKAWTPGTVKPR